MNESQFRTLVRHIITEANKVLDEDSNTSNVGGAVDIPAAFSGTSSSKRTKKKKPVQKKKKFIPDTTFEPYAKPKPKKKSLKEDNQINLIKAKQRLQQMLKSMVPPEDPMQGKEPENLVNAVNKGPLWKEVAPPGMEDVVMDLKKKYPKKNAFKIAWSIHNKKK